MRRIKWLISPSWQMVIILAVYLPFEAILLKLFPQNIQVIAYLLPEIIIWTMFIALILRQVLSNGTWCRTVLDGPLILFGITVFFSVLINQVFTLGMLVNVNALLKYIPVYYLAAHSLLFLRKTQIQLLFKVIIVVAILEITLGSLQIMKVSWVSNVLQPVAVQLGEFSRSSNVLSGARELGAVYGTFGDTIHYGWFLSVALILLLSRIQVIVHNKRWLHWILICLILVFIGFSYSRILIFSAFFILAWRYVFFLVSKEDIAPNLLFVSLSIFLILLIVFYYAQDLDIQNSVRAQQNFIIDSLRVFTTRYRNIVYKYGRLGWLIEGPLTVILNKPLIGFGPDPMIAYEQLNNAKTTFISSVRPLSTMEDVYWVALLIYYGLLGLVAWLWILIRHYRLGLLVRRLSLIPLHRQIAWISLLYIPLMGLAQFGNQAFEFRIASYYFWVFLGLLQGVYWTINNDSRLPQNSVG